MNGIDRQNFTDVKKYLEYHEKVLQNDPKTIELIRGYLRHLLNWADNIPFPRSMDIKPVFGTYILTARNDTLDISLSAATIKKICDYGRRYFIHCKMNYPGRYKKINDAWIDTIRPPKRRGTHSELINHEFFTLDEITKIAAMPADTLRLERDRAAAVFLFLSGMRIGAFVSLPVKAVDLENRTVLQLPELGVRTKNNKAAKTFLYPIPGLLEVVKAWHERVKNYPDSMWYVNINPTKEILTFNDESKLSRGHGLNRGLEDICNICGIKYKSAHKLRHGHIVWGVAHVKDMAGLKSISQNVMHSSVGITDSLYGRFTDETVRNVIAGIGGGDPGELIAGIGPADNGNNNLDQLVQLIMEKMKGEGGPASVGMGL